MNWLRAFEASARHLSFTRAATDLNLTPTAVSYQVRALEQTLHHQLFERLPRSLRLTEMGAAYLPNVRRAFEDISATTVKLFGQSGSGKLTIRAPVSFLTLWLAPRLQRFQNLHAGIDIFLLAALWADAQPDHAVDIDIRFGNGDWPGYKVQLLRHDPSVAVCTPSLAVGESDSERLLRVLNGSLVHVVGHENHWADTFRRLGVTPPQNVRALRADNSITAISMAASGGAAIVLRPYAEWAIRIMGLHRLFEFTVPVEQSHFLVTPSASEPSRREVLLFREWLLEEASGHGGEPFQNL